MLRQITFALLFLGIAINAELTREQIISVENALKDAIALDNQCETSNDCDALPVGARGCGGPSSYVAHSVKSSNIEYIRWLGQVTTEFEKQYNLENSVISICSLITKPDVACDNTNKCVASSSIVIPDIQ